MCTWAVCRGHSECKYSQEMVYEVSQREIDVTSLPNTSEETLMGATETTEEAAAPPRILSCMITGTYSL